MRIDAAFLDAADRITLALTHTLDPWHLPDLTVGGGPYTIASAELRGGTEAVYDLTLDRPVADADVGKLSVTVPGLEAERVYARDVLCEPRFTADDAELGSRWSADATTFRTWSPVSSAVEVLLGEQAVPMSAVGRGVWEARVEGDLHNRPYRLRFHNYGQARAVPDVHCHAADADSRWSVVIDPARCAPAGWADDAPPPAPATDVLYEVHVRDYSIRDEGCPQDLRGTYAGLTHDHAGGGGLRHLTDLGVTAVHLLPVQDYLADRQAYNWGYWTALFNAAESAYATDPADATCPPRELRALVRDLHAAGLRVVIDVVYNHTATARGQAMFQAACPFYYVRTSDDGRLLDDSGTGNSLADERPMVRKFVRDSLLHWLDFYHVDGFRFDLLGTHHQASVKDWADAVRAARPGVILYGEPWTGGGPTHFGKGDQRGTGCAVFNDGLRDALRGDLDGTKPGFATGDPAPHAAAVASGLLGGTDDFADAPAEAVNYVSAHDNLALWDKIGRTAPHVGEPAQRAMQRLALAAVLLSQGHAFLHAGSDFCRTKRGHRDTYNLGDDVNGIDWDGKTYFRAVHAYLAGLIRLRRSLAAFRLPDPRRQASILRADAVVAAEYRPDGGPAVVVALNGSDADQHLDLPPGDWHQLADADHAGPDPLRTVTSPLHLPPLTLAVLRR